VSIIDELVQQALVLGRLAAQLELQILQRHEHLPSAVVESDTPWPAEPPRGKTQARVLEYIDAHGEGDTKAIAAGVGGNAEVVRQAVGKLVKLGVLERNGKLVKRRHPV